jgi:hypothetical protein
MGVDVASFGDFFADKRLSVKEQVITDASEPKTSQLLTPPSSPQLAIEVNVSHPRSKPVAPNHPHERLSPHKKRAGRKADGPIKCLVYNDPFGPTYKKYIFTADGKHLLGGMMIGDVSDFVKLVSIVKKKVCAYSPYLYCFFMTESHFRNLSTFHPLNLSSAPRKKGKEMATILMMTPRFAVVTYVSFTELMADY